MPVQTAQIAAERLPEVADDALCQGSRTPRSCSSTVARGGQAAAQVGRTVEVIIRRDRRSKYPRACVEVPGTVMEFSKGLCTKFWNYAYCP